MNNHGNNGNPRAVSGWEDDGGAQSEAGRRTGTVRTGGDKRLSEQQHFDASHESSARGEHRYDAAHQTGAEQQARQERDKLKQRLAGRATRRDG
jgi:hypothetical protein